MARVGVCDLLLSRPQCTVAHPKPFKTFNCRVKSRSLAVRVAAEKSGGAFPENIINQISVAVTNFSPANAVKKAIASAQAGQYDEAAISGKVDAYIRDNPVCRGPLLPGPAGFRPLLISLGTNFSHTRSPMYSRSKSTSA